MTGLFLMFFGIPIVLGVVMRIVLPLVIASAITKRQRAITPPILGGQQNVLVPPVVGVPPVISGPGYYNDGTTIVGLGIGVGPSGCVIPRRP